MALLVPFKHYIFLITPEKAWHLQDIFHINLRIYIGRPFSLLSSQIFLGGGSFMIALILVWSIQEFYVDNEFQAFV